VSRHENAGQNHSSQITDKCFEKIATFRRLATTVTSQNCIHEEIKSRLKSGNSCCRSVQTFVFPSLSKNLNIKM